MPPAFDILIQDFFCRRLIEQQGVSPRTVEAYRDTFRLLLAYLPQRLGKPVPSLALSDLDAPIVLAFLTHLETERGNSPRSAQRPPGGSAPIRAVRGVSRPDRVASGSSGVGHSFKALCKAAARLPKPRRDAGRPYGLRRRDMVRAERPSAARRDVQHRGSCV